MARIFDSLGVDIRAAMKPLSDALQSMTLLKRTAGTPATQTGGDNATFKSYPCRGMVKDFRESAMKGDRVKAGDRRVRISGVSLDEAGAPAPAANDRVTLPDGTTWIVHAIIKVDPAEAFYTLHLRGRVA